MILANFSIFLNYFRKILSFNSSCFCKIKGCFLRFSFFTNAGNSMTLFFNFSVFFFFVKTISLELRIYLVYTS